MKIQPKQEAIKPSTKSTVEEVLTKKPVTTEDPLLKLAARPFTTTQEPYFEDIKASIPEIQLRKEPIPTEVVKTYLSIYPKVIILSFLPASFDSFIESITQAVNTRVAKTILISHPEIRDWVEIITYASTGNVSAMIAFTQNDSANCFSTISAFTSTLDLKKLPPLTPIGSVFSTNLYECVIDHSFLEDKIKKAELWKALGTFHG